MSRDNVIQWGDWCLGFPDHYMKHVIFDDHTISTMNNTFAEVARYALYGPAKQKIATDGISKSKPKH